MFHLMLVLPALIVLAVIISIVLFSTLVIVAALVGGTSASILIKNKTIKKLLFVGFCILFLVGFLCLTPIIIGYAGLSVTFFSLVSVFIYLCIIVLTIAGIKLSSPINNKIGKTILIVIFCIILIVAISLIIVTAIASRFLL